MSIYVRPVREQIEHDRVIRYLQSKLKRKFDVAANVGAEQSAATVKGPTGPLFPDLVLTTMDRARKIAAVVEVETGESVHHLEAMAQWAPFSRLKIPFHLYVPVASADIARRLAADLGAQVTELWSYQAIGDQIRLTLVQKSAAPTGRPAVSQRDVEKRPAKPAAKTKQPATKPAPAKARAKAKVKAAKPRPAAARKPARKPAAKKPARRPAAKRK